MSKSVHMNEWTIVFLVYIEKDLTGHKSKLAFELDKLFDDLTKVTLNKHFKILVLFNEVENSGDIAKEQTSLLQVEAGSIEGSNTFREIFCTPTDFFMQDEKKIGEILKRIDNNEIEGLVTSAKRYMVVTWG